MSWMMSVRFGARTLPADRAAVLATVHRHPDSGYDQGATCADAAAPAAVDRAVDEGADIVHLSGGPAGPGGDVAVTEQTRQVVPLVAAVRRRHPELLISVDARRCEVARAALDAGADILHTGWAGVDPTVAEVAAECGGGVVCSYTGAALSGTRPHRVHRTDVVRDIVDDLVAQAEKLVTLGVPREAILIDPTRGCGKNAWLGVELLCRCDELIAPGWPVLMALSGEDFVGQPPGTAVDDRAEATLAATALAAWAGVRVFRARRVRQTRRALEMVASIAGTRAPARAVRGLAGITARSVGADG